MLDYWRAFTFTIRRLKLPWTKVIFQDSYNWAGQFRRTVNIARSGQYVFAFWDRIEPALHETLSKLTR